MTYCDVQGGSTGTGIINLDPLFADPDGPDNDPATWQDNDYRPAAGSPCIDAGKNAAFPTGILTDLDGRLRFFDDPDSPDCRYVPGTCGTAPIIDMGAYEYQPLVILLGDLNCDGLLDIGDVAAFALSLVDPAGYGAAYPECDIGRADMNADGAADGLDVQPFVDALLGG